MSHVSKGDGGGSNARSKASTSVTAKLREQAELDAVIQSDPKYKKYAQQVEKCLATFETMHEWPDFIAFLKQLLKTLQSYTQFKEIPRKLVVSKRLSQCLIPALPSGVHQRALDVYSHILSVLGSEGLKRDLPLWSSGLFPFFEYASTSVKPSLLEIFEKHYLPLQYELRPVMRGFILALLPGLEEETGEFFERVMSLLDRLSGTVSPSFFLQNIWLVMLTTQVPRAYCINYLSRRLPQSNAGEDITPIVGRDIGLMIRAFAAALEDDNILVQRGALDLLLQFLRIESAAVKQAAPADRTILMRAATGVVLRRDLSLNRRLFSWLLGSDEQNEKQIEYYQENTLGLLEETLRDEMYHPSSEYSVARPFKIYVSLLDKWEIGAPLTEVLIYDALKAIKSSVENSSGGGEDVLITANTLYEAVEPRAIWKHLYKTIREEVITSESNRTSVDMLLFVLKTFRVEDDEVQSIHLPLIFCALVEKLELLSRKDARRITTTSFRAAMELLDQITILTSISSLTSPLHLANFAFGGSFDDAACAFYGLEPGTSDAATESPDTIIEKRWSSAVPFIASFERLADLTSTCVERAVGNADKAGVDCDNSSARMHAFVQCITLLLKLVTGLSNATSVSVPLRINWDAEQWLDCISRPLSSQGCSFLAADRVVSFAILLHATTAIEPTPSIDNRARLLAMMTALMFYLRLETSPYHVRAVRLIWDLEHVTTHHHLESIISQNLVSGKASNVFDAFSAFGALWRLSEDEQQTGMHFKIPMLIVLDTLRSDEPILRRIGETWMRCNLKSYPRVLDPILVEILNPDICRIVTTMTMRGREMTELSYVKPFDQQRIAYLLDILFHIVRFGGQNFSRVAATTHLAHSFCTQLVERVTQGGLSVTEATYSTVLIDTLLKFLLSEPKPVHITSMRTVNIQIHSSAIDILQSLVSRGDLGHDSIQSIQSAVVDKLYSLIHTSRPELQNKLLHLLHSVISLSSVSRRKQHMRNVEIPTQTIDPTPETVLGASDAEPSGSAVTSPFLTQLLVAGITAPSNRPLLHHWLDFVLMTVPQFPHVWNTAIYPLNSCICRQIRSSLDDISLVLSLADEPERQVISYADDAEFIMLFNALERLILLSFDGSDPSSLDETSPTEKANSDGTGIFSMVSNVFLTDSQSHPNDSVIMARSPAYRCLHEGIGVLYATWSLVTKDPKESHPAYETLLHIFGRTSSRCRKVLEKLFRAHAFEVIESVVEYWSVEQGNQNPGNVGFEIVDFLTASSQNVVHMVCESISWRINQAGERNRRQVLNPELSDGVLFTFLEEYLLKLENPLAVQVWPRYLALAKDIASNVKEFRLQVFPVLRCMTVLSLKISQTTAIEDRKMRKDIQENYIKLLDACVLMSGRSLDQGIWPRRAKDTLGVNGRDSTLSRVQSETNLNEKLAGLSVPAVESAHKSPEIDITDRINHYLADVVLPNLRRFFVENDKILAACNNIVYYIISPALKDRTSRTSDVDDIFTNIIEQLSKIPAAVKSWRNPAMDVFSDSKFFATTPASGLKWRTIIKTLIDADKAAFSELLGKIASAPSANIFINREYEMLLRAQSLRRLSFVLFASEKNHFLTQLPAIQEKLVDILRNGSAPVVESQVYLCIRVLLCRLSPHNLSSFWPVLLAEFIRVFELVIAEPPSDGAESLQSILSACKLVDILLVLQTVEFQIHQWIFITDTVDAVYRPDGWFPDAIMDQLAETVGDLPATETRRPTVVSLPDSTSARGLRQPLLKSVRQIDSIHDLAPFFSHLSILSYEGVYASGGVVDWEAVEQSLVEDMFDGR